MNFRIVLVLIVFGFVVFCGWLVLESGPCETCRSERGPCILLQQTTDTEKGESTKAAPARKETLEAADSGDFRAAGGPTRKVPLGSLDPKSGFKLLVELSSKGAAIEKATFSEFDDRDYKDPQPLVILSPVRLPNNKEILSMSLMNFGLFLEPKSPLLRPFSLEQLSWQSFDVVKAEDGSQTARFQAFIIDDKEQPVVELNITYKVALNSYLLDYLLTVENLSASEQKVRFNLGGPVGLGRESFRSDMRQVIAGFRNAEGQVVSTGLNTKKLNKATDLEGRRLTNPGANFLWIAAINKYFAAIVVPVADEGKDFCDWVADKTGRFYNPDGDERSNSGDETIGLDLKIASSNLAPADQANSKKTYKFQLYLGPKDKSLFDKTELYEKLGFAHTITFMPCFCCPTCLIHPIAFAILALMKWMHTYIIGNYGIVIIILVFMFRLVMHPITKKSQISMRKMTKLGPKAEEIKKKYANNKTEMNKQMMALYKEQGASPIMGFLPMMVQMPIWIALWSAVYASIELRGEGFLPFWITDLSMPDALYRFPTTIIVPLLGWKIESLNLLPLLMGLAFYLQQKLMPHQAGASANPQVAQQQKMMMIMMPLLFPLMLYKAPSGVNLYIMSSTFAGVFEQYVIRKHIREKEEAESKGLVAVTSKTGGKVKKKKPKPFYKI
ncbi:MAG: YidC/Oxa1 family insertase periplasmic-domain containing protein [Planctomycetota bacterium]|jgi:YidC/Oxa1 family membrane protein insertase